MSPSQRFLLAIIVVAFSLVFVLIAIHLITGGFVPFHYGIVFELKSTNTSVSLYKWTADLSNNTGLVDLDDYCESTEDIEDSKAGSAQDVNNLIPCFNRFVRKTSDLKINDVGVFVGATSSMRHLLLTDPDSARRQMTDINEMLNNRLRKQSRTAPNKTAEIIRPKILTDEDEATYLWIAFNYLRNNFVNKTTNRSNKRKDTEGLIYIDDYQSLIAYEFDSEKYVKDSRAIELYGRNYSLRVDGSLCNGIEQIYNKYLVLLIMKQGAESFITDPCGVKEQQRIIDGNQFANNSCVLKNNSIEIDTSKTYHFVSKYDYEQCLITIKSIFDENACSVSFGICPQSEPKKPDKHTKFVVIQKPYSYFNDEIVGRNKLSWIDDYVNISKNTCDDILRKRYEVENSTRTHLTQCFVMNYFHVLLKKVYKIGENEWQNIRFEIKPSNKVRWSLGYTIYATSFAAAIDPTKTWISMQIIIITSAICLVLITIVLCLIRRKLNNSEVSLEFISRKL